MAFLLVQVSTCEGGENFLLKKGTSKDSQGFIKISPFVAPTTSIESPTGNAPIVFLGQGETELQRLQWSFSTPQQGARAWKPLPPNDSLKASLSPPVGGRLRSFRRDWQTNVHPTC